MNEVLSIFMFCGYYLITAGISRIKSNHNSNKFHIKLHKMFVVHNTTYIMFFTLHRTCNIIFCTIKLRFMKKMRQYSHKYKSHFETDFCFRIFWVSQDVYSRLYIDNQIYTLLLQFQITFANLSYWIIIL